MSKLIAFAAIQGGYKVVSEAEGLLNNALKSYNADTKVEFPNTGYFLPVIYSLTGLKVKNLEDLKKPLEFARGLLPPHVKGKNHLPFLGPLLDAGMAGIIAYEIKEGIRAVTDPDFYYPHEDPDVENGKIWTGPADDTILRKRGVE
ncbi:MAG TPA: CO dehydrogenase/CO-methylating acetyl-CoA synthase complex subunit beta, partial [Desulfobacteraceae bacterium]|nr:CO dehydrogenase/CO-methylating acetyl-CoA synthase complex subunit beta [Desulfobacteraceae bacterium]